MCSLVSLAIRRIIRCVVYGHSISTLLLWGVLDHFGYLQQDSEWRLGNILIWHVEALVWTPQWAFSEVCWPWHYYIIHICLFFSHLNKDTGCGHSIFLLWWLQHRTRVGDFIPFLGWCLRRWTSCRTDVLIKTHGRDQRWTWGTYVEIDHFYNKLRHITLS